jgi:hypothetical protein
MNRRSFAAAAGGLVVHFASSAGRHDEVID